MNQELLFIFWPGINQFPNDSRLWEAWASYWYTKKGLKNGFGYYFCTAIMRRFHQSRRINHFCDVFRELTPGPSVPAVRIACHSNGTDIVLKGLAKMGWPFVDQLHLISGACESDFDKNGLNEALRRGSVGKVVVYIAGQDKALAFADTWLGRMIGYGNLGKVGPQNADPGFGPDRLNVIRQTMFGHSDWFNDCNWDMTMNYFL